MALISLMSGDVPLESGFGTSHNNRVVCAMIVVAMAIEGIVGERGAEGGFKVQSAGWAVPDEGG